MAQDNVTGYAPVNGINMYYEIHGEGKPLVLIHGGGSTIRTTFGNVLADLAKQYKVIAVELQAHGHTNDRHAPETFEQDADDVAALLKHLSIAKASIFGFSNGGNTTMQLANRHPEVVDKLIIASSFYKRDGLPPGFFEGMKSATLEVMPKPLTDAFLKINPDTSALQNMFNKDRERMMNFTDWDDSVLTSIKTPALLICGDRDVVLPTHAVKMSQLIPNCRLMILPAMHGGYMGTAEVESEGRAIIDMTIAQVVKFLNE